MKIIVIANQKGGVGKTTTATSVANILTNQGFKTLLIDADQQGNSTDTYHAEVEGVATLYDVLLEKEENRIELKEAIQTTEHGDIVASDPLLMRADEVLRSDVEGIYRLKDALERLEGYDYVIIDTAPAMDSMLHNCLVAADDVIIPVTTDRYALQGLSKLQKTITAIKKRQNPGLNIAGFVFIKYNARTNLAKEVREEVKIISEKMGTKVFQTVIRDCTKTREAQALRNTVVKYAPNSTTAQDYGALVKEIIGE